MFEGSKCHRKEILTGYGDSRKMRWVQGGGGDWGGGQVAILNSMVKKKNPQCDALFHS